MIVVSLGTVIYWETVLPPAVPPSARRLPGGAVAPPVATPQEFEMPPLRLFSEVLDRPLFSLTRRPDPAAAAGAAPDQTPSRLVGIVFSDTQRMAIVEIGQPARIERAAEGVQVGTWMIERILADRIIIQSPSGRAELKPGLPVSDAGNAVQLRRQAPAAARTGMPKS